MRHTILLALSALYVCLGASALFAHHSHATLDPEDVRILTGVVTKYSWSMPHVYLKVLAPNLEGKAVEYSIEMLHPAAMAERGWGKDSFQAGDSITWQGKHDRNKARAYSDLSWAEKNGIRIGAGSAVQGGIMPSTDFTGLWNRAPNQPTYFPPDNWPLNTTGQILVDGFSEDQNPILTCGDPGPPKSMTLPYAHLISRPDEDTIIIERDLMEGRRVVHLEDELPKVEPSKLGYSHGWFEGEDLLVQTTSFIEDKWGAATGIDSSPQKELLERFHLAEDGLGLEITFTLTDPVYLREPVVFTHRWVKVPERELVQTPCTRESAQLWIEGGYGNTP